MDMEQTFCETGDMTMSRFAAEGVNKDYSDDLSLILSLG